MPDITNNTEEDTHSCLPKPIDGFDAAVLNDLVESDPEMYNKFTLMFIDSFETALANIDSALEVGDRRELGAMGHRAKSTARNIGATALGDKCETLEDIATTANIEEVTRVAVGLRAMFDAVCCKLSRRIDPGEHGI